MNYILTYYNLIVSGKINVSKKLRKTFDKVVKDLTDTTSEYHFDIKKANRPIDFIEKFCKHSKGKWLGKPVILELWQKAIIQTIFGFVDKNGNRKYKEVLLVVGRKNGKSTLLSALALYMLFADGEGGAQVGCVASKKDQAKIVFNEAKNMVAQNSVLNKHIKKRKNDLYFAKTFSTFEPLASDSDTLDGLNLHCGIIDELHCIKDRNIYDVSKQSMSARQQPLLLMITTAGFVRENIYDERYEYADKVINNLIEDERFIAFIYELDSKSEWLQEECWIKANPSLGSIKSLTYMKEQVETAKNSRQYLPTVLTKDFNIRETAVGSWLTFEDINNEQVYDLNSMKVIYAVGGVDLSSVGDLTCSTIVFKKGDQWYSHQMYFIPGEIAEKKEKEDHVPYKIWRDLGLVRFCAGNKVDYSDVTEWFKELRDKNNIYVLWIGYDSWSAELWVADMKNNGFVMEEVIQGARTMSAPMKSLACDLAAKKINYNNSPILKWCLTNTKIEVDKNDNIRPIKGKNPKQRIDGAVSLIDAYVILQRHYEDYLAMTACI